MEVEVDKKIIILDFVLANRQKDSEMSTHYDISKLPADSSLQDKSYTNVM